MGRTNTEKSSKISKLLGLVSHIGRTEQHYSKIPNRRTSVAARPKPAWSPSPTANNHPFEANPDEFKHLPRRERSLSIQSRRRYNLIDLSEEDEDQEQIQSSFFRLPVEVRQLIYEQVFLDGSQVFHVVRRRQDKMAFKRCQCVGGGEGLGWPNGCWELACRGVKMESGVFEGTGDGGIFPLLQTCRKVYTEATPTLYTTPTYDFDSLESLIAFSCSILPRRFDAIKSIQLDLRFHMSDFFNESMPKTDAARWQRTWRILASMPRLNCLRVRITWPVAEVERRLEERYLEPLAMVTGLDIFEVVLPWYREESGAVKGDRERDGDVAGLSLPLPCKLLRPERGSGGLARRVTVL